MDNWLWLIYGPAQLIERAPAAGFAIGVIALAAQAIRSALRGDRVSREWLRYPLVLGGLLWLLFTLYELQMIGVGLGLATTRVRLDLIVLTPILYGISAFALMSLFGFGGAASTATVDNPTENSPEQNSRPDENRRGEREQ